MNDPNLEYLEFTEGGFRSLLRTLRDGAYRFAKYGDGEQTRSVLWRHDIDVSVHRAFRLAKIEAEEGALSTYFVNPRSIFYNFLEPGILLLLKEIRALGHDLGLHFDAELKGRARWTSVQLETAVRSDRSILETALGDAVNAVSWHNPDLSNLLEFDAEEIGGLTSAYSARLRREYVYCSDSNGYWRFKPMKDVIAEGHPRLHLLTHPEWWVPEPLSPSDRIDRAVMGRARAVKASYDDLLMRAGRKNLGSSADVERS